MKIRKIDFGNLERQAWKRAKSKDKIFQDYDKDNVPNVFDCRPRNPKKQDYMTDQLLKQAGIRRVTPGSARQTLFQRGLVATGIRPTAEEAALNKVAQEAAMRQLYREELKAKWKRKDIFIDQKTRPFSRKEFRLIRMNEEIE